MTRNEETMEKNDVGRPNFHFDIIKGDSISLSKTEDTYKVTATAEKAGTTVVKVTYDDLDYKDKHWGAISPVNTAYAVFTVGEEGKATITPSDNLKNWRHYDTIYYCEGETVPYTFTVNTENAVAVKVTVNGQVIDNAVSGIWLQRIVLLLPLPKVENMFLKARKESGVNGGVLLWEQTSHRKVPEPQILMRRY